MKKSVFILSGFLFVSACSEKKAPPATKAAVPVKAATVVVKDVPSQLRIIGNVEPYSTVSVKSQVNGELKSVHFREGQDVRKGELLFEIDKRPLETELQRVEANLAKDTAQGKQAEANLARDAAQAKHAQVETERYRQLVEKGVAAKEEADRMRTNSEALEATLRADQAAVENFRQSVVADRAAIDSVKLQIEYCTIHAPIAGRTGSILVQAGNLVRANDSQLVVINQVVPLYVNFAVPEQNLPEIKKFMAEKPLKVQAVVSAADSAPAEGVLGFVDNRVDSTTGTIRLKATFANEDRRLWPGQFVNVVMTLTSNPNSIVVPSQAIQTGQNGEYVFVIKPDQKVEYRLVKVGKSFGEETVVEKGLQPGEKVVTDGQLRLVPDAKVDIKGGAEPVPPPSNP